MVLAAFGTYVAERTLVAQAHMEPDGTEIGELERLARQFGLMADIEETTVRQLRRILAKGMFPIAYIDRAVFDLTPRQRAKHSLRNARIHTVVVTRITATAITYHDPLSPRITRKSIRLFRLAYDCLGSRSAVCSKLEDS
jgi:hypothetical protein